MKWPNVDWCDAVMEGISPVEPRAHLHCRRCGARVVPVLPMAVDGYLKTMRSFLRDHASCKAPKEQ